MNNFRYSAYVVSSVKYPIRKSTTYTLLQNLDLFDIHEHEAFYPTSIDKKWCSMKVGQYGCAASHRLLWKKIIDSEDPSNKWYFVFEDDIILPRDYTSKHIRFLIQDSMKQADEKNVQIIYFGHCWTTLCTHAYACKLDALKMLYDNTYDCIKHKSQPIDNQMSDVIIKHKIKTVYVQPSLENSNNAWGKGIIHQRHGTTM